MVNLSFSFRTPSTSSYLLVGVNERGQEKTEDYQPWKRELMNRWLVVVFSGLSLLSFTMGWLPPAVNTFPAHASKRGDRPMRRRKNKETIGSSLGLRPPLPCHGFSRSAAFN